MSVINHIKIILKLDLSLESWLLLNKWTQENRRSTTLARNWWGSKTSDPTFGLTFDLTLADCGSGGEIYDQIKCCIVVGTSWETFMSSQSYLHIPYTCHYSQVQ